MTMLSPAATSHAELREQLSGVGRALSTQRALLWLTRGAAAGTIAMFGVVMWAWTRDAVSTLPLPLMAAAPVVLGVVIAATSLVFRIDLTDLARRVDRAAHLQERSTTALELGARGDEFPLALAQMRDAVEHLRRVDMLEAFPIKVPRTELLTIFFVALIAVLVGISPNPWLLRARASNPAITIAREEAQRVQRLADSMQPQDSPEIDPLRQLVSQGAKTMDARSNEPDAALNALQDLEDQIRQMSAGDDQLTAALSAIASALAQDPATQQLANAINTGDLREISRATRDLAQQAEQLNNSDKARVAKVLRDASGKAMRSSQGVANDLAAAAAALQASAAGENSDPSSSQYGQESATDAQYQQSAQDALNQLSNSTAAAAERQRTQSQLESSRNALERALGRTQSRSGSSSGSNGRSSSSGNGQRNQNQNGTPAGDQGQGNGQGQNADTGDNGDGTGSGGSSPGDNGSNGQGDGSGYSTGGQSQTRTGGSQSGLDTITRPEQVPNSGQVPPDESSQNPFLGDAGQGPATASEESVQPAYSRKPTQGNDSGTIPLGLRDLVKDYFSSLDQNQK